MDTPELADQTKTFIHLLCADTRCRLEDLQVLMVKERVKKIYAASTS